ncbi:hypothetical protein SNE40_012585 [Patella caerulea]|uniref:Jumping translocation breakpoint protein n=1 Tax=Patella caerulea TaxID=87958 RepID=A0AAN8JRX7_PATCE
MIEFCSKRRMLFVIAILTCLSIVTLFFENRWSNQRILKEAKVAAAALMNASCNPGVVTVLETCKICPREENKKELSFCRQTGYKEFVQCPDGKKIFRGCDLYLPANERKTFWIFEATWLIIAVVFYSIVRKRQKVLDNQAMDKINKQIASGL